MTQTKNSTKLLALLLALFSVAIHAYLASEHYSIRFGASTGKSICDLSATFSCGAVAASEYSTFLGVPIAVYGAWTNIVLAVFLLAWLFSNATNSPWQRYAFWLSAITTSASVIMAVISLSFMTVYCPFCILLYLISGVILFILWRSFTTPPWPHLMADIRGPLKGNFTFWGWVLLVPIGAWIVNQGAYKKVGGPETMRRVIEDNVAIWENNPEQKFDVSASVVSGAADAPITLVEFADFRCPHCKHAGPVIDAFLATHHDVKLHFMVFPLDGECNKAIPRSSGLSCRLAKALYCIQVENPTSASKAKTWLFEQQEHYDSLTSIDEQLKSLSQNLSMDWNKLQECLTSEAAQKAIESQAQQGADAKIQGTPAFFLNGKSLPGGQFLPILDAAYQKAKASSKGN